MIPYKFNPLGVDLVSVPPVVPPEGSAEDDLAILRGLRDNNPGSIFGVMYPEGVDPYTQWAGLTFNANNRVTTLSTTAAYSGAYTRVFPNINKLTYLKGLSLSQSPYPACNVVKNTPLVELVLDGLVNLETITFSGYNVKTLSLKNLPKVTSFVSWGCRAESVNTFFDFSECPAITSFDLWGTNSSKINTFGESNIKNVDISKLTKLISMKVRNTSIASLPFPITCPDLKSIVISGNQISQIPNLKLSQHLLLDGCNVQNNFFNTMPFIDLTKAQYQATPYSPEVVNNLLTSSELSRLRTIGLLDAILLPQSSLGVRTIITTN